MIEKQNDSNASILEIQDDIKLIKKMFEKETASTSRRLLGISWEISNLNTRREGKTHSCRF